MKLEPPGRADKILNKAIQEISAKKRAAMRSFQVPGFQPVRPETSTNSIENNLEATDLEDEDEENADERGESGGMRSRPQPRKPSRQEVEAHMIDHHPFRSWCRCCVMTASRSDHHRRQAEDYNEVPVISCDCGFFFFYRQQR